MNILDFITRNYINILLIGSFIGAIFLTNFKKDKRSIFAFVFLACSLVFTIFHYININTDTDIYSLPMALVIVIEIFLFSFYIVPFNKYSHLVFFVPLVISLIAICISFIYHKQIIVGAIGCAVYLILFLIRSVFLIKRGKDNGGVVLLVCCAIAIASLLLDYFTKDLSIFNNVLIVCFVVFFVRYFTLEENKKKVSQEKYIQNQKTSIAISQIQPHFLYNSLATIGYLCNKDPKTASLAIDKFSDYLRANLNSLSQMSNVPFNEELRHVQTYLWLEKLRFEDRLQIVYDIQISDFLVPSLSIQPLVENAVKHGICNKIDGGTITIRTVAYNECIKIVIEDDGIGFEIKDEKKNDGKTHVGIENVKSRIISMAQGTLEIQSSVGKGTISTITLPRR